MEPLKTLRFDNLTLDWDESAYSILYHLYNIDISEGNAQSYINLNSYGSINYFNDSGNEIQNKELEKIVRFYVEGIGVLIIIVLGILGNILSMYIMSRKKMRVPINCLFLGLAVADTLFLTGNIVLLALPMILGYFECDFSFLAIITPYVFPIVVMSHASSVYLTLAVTGERYVAVYYPFHARSHFTWRRASYIVFAIFVLSIIYNFPRLFEYTSVGIEGENGDIVRYVPITTQLRRDAVYDKYYVYAGFCVLIWALPLFTLIFLNIRIFKIVKRANLQRRSMTRSELNENQLALMLLMVVLVFILCNALSLVGVMAKFLTGSPTIFILDSFRNLFIVFNSSINFVIYCAYGEKFREIFLDMFPRWARRAYFKNYKEQISQMSRSSSTDKNRPISTISLIPSTIIIMDGATTSKF